MKNKSSVFSITAICCLTAMFLLFLHGCRKQSVCPEKELENALRTIEIIAQYPKEFAVIKMKNAVRTLQQCQDDPSYAARVRDGLMKAIDIYEKDGTTEKSVYNYDRADASYAAAQQIKQHMPAASQGQPSPTVRAEPTPTLVPGGIVIADFSFIDALTKTPVQSSEINKLLTEAIREGIAEASQQNSKIVHRIISEEPKLLLDLIELIFHPQLTGDQKITHIVQDIMRPNNLDIIVCGQYIESQTDIQVRPFVINKTSRVFISKDVTFTKEKFGCSSELCPQAHQEIVHLVRELLEQL